MTFKICDKCTELRSVSLFNKNRKNSDGITGVCKICTRKIYYSTANFKKRLSRKLHRKPSKKGALKSYANCDAKRDYAYRTKYGISLNIYETKLKEQNYGCDICKRDVSNFTKRLCVDHNHKTNIVRGLLCYYCNKFRVGRHDLQSSKDLYEYMLRHEKPS